MKLAPYHPWLHRLAVATMILALLPIIMGALVTSLQAGMAFLDWPSSDGHNMFLYPWLESLGDRDKFVEHGHRLAGALIGLVSIALASAAWKWESRQSVRWACYAVLLAVIVQGLLGGARVRMDARIVAMVHGSFAALVFALMASVSVATSRTWIGGYAEPNPRSTPRKVAPVVSLLATGACVVIFLQYLVGGFVRHLGLALHEHLAGAVLVLAMVTATMVAAHRSTIPIIRRAGWLMFGVMVFQVLLGLSSWVMKFGFGGYVPTVHSTPHIVVRTAHTVMGMFLLASAVILKLKTARYASVAHQAAAASDLGNSSLSPASLTWEGGVR